ncbi:MAG: glycosyltransferase [Anaerolineae bacterium]|nr:glycosyltransferase [Anaerolineae bacterium]MDW8100537.1 glycosyltransferase [Anaerolineae bacterium]
MAEGDRQRIDAPPQAAKAAEPLRIAQDLCWQAVSDFQAGRYKDAASRLQKALSIHPSLYDVHFLLGACYQRLGRLEEAAREAEIELQAHPDHVLAWSLLGQVRLSQGRIAEASAIFQRVQQLEPESWEARFHLHSVSEASFSTVSPPRWPPISVCMIVRDEEAVLARCLRSLGDLASQLIVVDTGSQDRTVEIARSFGAEVYHFQWVDDFSAARNESLRHARGEWIFWLDADDELSPEAVAQVKNAVASGQADAYVCRVASRLPNGTEDIVPHARIFRNGLGLRFHGRIHESVWTDIIAKGLKVLDTDIVIVHHGYETDWAVLRSKHERNLAYVERELERYPDNPGLLCYFGMAKMGLGDIAAGEAALRRVIELPPMNVRFDSFRFWAWASLIRLGMARGEDETARQMLNRALGEFPGHPYFLALSGDMAFRSGELSEAWLLWHAAYERDHALVWGYRPDRRSLALGIAAGCAMAGDMAKEAQWFERAGQVGEEGVKVYLRFVQQLIRQRKLVETRRVLEAAQIHWPRHPMVRKGLTLVYERLGQPMVTGEA